MNIPTEWIKHGENLIYTLNVYNTSSRNVLFVSLQGLVRSKGAKETASVDDWVFYSDSTAYYLSNLTDWYLVLYDYENNLNLIDSVITHIDKDLMVILGPKGSIVETYISINQDMLNAASCIIGDEVGELEHYTPDEIFPDQYNVILPEKLSVIIPIGNVYSGREKFFKDVDIDKYNIVEKRGNWKENVIKGLKLGKSIIIQGDNETRAERKEIIDLVSGVSTYAFLFTYRGEGDNEYSNSFEEPLKEEGFREIYRAN